MTAITTPECSWYVHEHGYAVAHCMPPEGLWQGWGENQVATTTGTGYIVEIFTRVVESHQSTTQTPNRNANTNVRSGNREASWQESTLCWVVYSSTHSSISRCRRGKTVVFPPPHCAVTHFNMGHVYSMDTRK